MRKALKIVFIMFGVLIGIPVLLGVGIWVVGLVGDLGKPEWKELAKMQCEVDFKEFEDDVKLDTKKNEQLNLETIFKNLKLLFKKRGYVVNLKELEKQNIGETINTLSMSAPFLLEEKQALLESQNLNSRKNNLEKILKTYIADNFNNTTIQ